MRRFELFAEGRSVARLEWRIDPRRDAGWYLIRRSGPPERLEVDAAIDELARDHRSGQEEWLRDAQLAGMLSSAFALDAAERALHRRPAQRTGRFRRAISPQRAELYVSHLDPATLRHAVPELTLESVSDVTVLAGDMLPHGLEVVVRRIALLGGRIVAVFAGWESPPDAA